MKILLTGSTGFVGTALYAELLRRQIATVRALRTGSSSADAVVVGNLDGDTDWSIALQGVDIVLHCAARAHIMRDSAVDPLAEFRKVNTDGTLNLARQAAAAGVKRLVYLSSIKVNGEATAPGRPFRESDPPHPVDPYGVSKYEAEQGLLALADSHGLEVVIIRPPLIYGPGVKANFKALLSLAAKRIPLPLALCDNRRSLLALPNLIDFMMLCARHPAAANQVFLLSDATDLSTAQLLRKIGQAFDKPALLWPLPIVWLRCLAACLGRQAQADRMFGSLQVDCGKAETLLGWQPIVSVDQALRDTAQAYLQSQPH